MQAFGRVDALYNDMAKQKEWQQHLQSDEGIPVAKVLQALKDQNGFGHYVANDWASLVSLRQNLSTFHCTVLKMCQFNAVCGLVRLKCSNFREVAKVDKRCPWVKCSLILHLYMATRDDKKMVFSLVAATRVAISLSPMAKWRSQKTSPPRRWRSCATR